MKLKAKKWKAINLNFQSRELALCLQCYLGNFIKCSTSKVKTKLKLLKQIWTNYLLEIEKVQKCKRKVMLRGLSRMIPAPLPSTLDARSARKSTMNCVWGWLCCFQQILPESHPWIVSLWVIRSECQTLTIRRTRLPSFLRAQAFSKPSWWGSSSLLPLDDSRSRA